MRVRLLSGSICNVMSIHHNEKKVTMFQIIMKQGSHNSQEGQIRLKCYGFICYLDSFSLHTASVSQEFHPETIQKFQQDLLL